MVGRPRLPGGHGRRPWHHRPRPGMGPRDLRGYEGRNAGRSGRGRQRPARGRRPAQRRCGITCGTAGCGRSGRRREPPTGASRHLPPAGGDSHAGPRQGVHDRLVVRRLPVRTGRAGRAERVQGRMRRRPAHRLDAVRHALHRALSGPRPGCVPPQRHRAGCAGTRPPAYADPRLRRRLPAGIRLRPSGGRPHPVHRRGAHLHLQRRVPAAGPQQDRRLRPGHPPGRPEAPPGEFPHGARRVSGPVRRKVHRLRPVFRCPGADLRRAAEILLGPGGGLCPPGAPEPPDAHHRRGGLF